MAARVKTVYEKRLDAIQTYSKKYRQFEDFIFAARNRMHMNLFRESSKTDPSVNSTLFFDIFMSNHIEIGKSISIKPVEWANAFMKRNFDEIQSILLRSVLISGVVEENDKIAAVQSAAKWMLIKNQDPWSYTWKENPRLDYFYLQLLDLENEILTDENLDRLKKLAESHEKITDLEFFKVVVSLGLLGNAALATRELTKITIRNNTEIFVDAVQFSKKRWTDAAKETKMAQIADQLFRKYWGTHCATNCFKSIDEICPVTRLAILRAVKWITENRSNTGILEFDSAEPHHNVYPSDSEVEDIETVFKKYVGTIRSRDGKPLPDPNFKKVDPIRMEYLDLSNGNQPRTLQSTVTVSSQGSEQEITGWLRANNIQFENDSSEASSSIPAEYSETPYVTQLESDSNMTDMDSNANEPDSVQDVPTYGQNAQLCQTEYSSTCLFNFRSENQPNSSNVGNAPLHHHSGPQLQLPIHNGITNLQIQPAMILPVVPVAIEQPIFDCICQLETVYLEIDSHLETGNVVITSQSSNSSYSMKRMIWNAAFKKYEDPRLTQAKVGRYLFGEIFEKHEMTQKANEKTFYLNPCKKKGILDSLSIMKTMIRKGLQMSSFDTGIRQEIRVHKRSVEELGFLEIKVFTDGRNHLVNFKPKEKNGKAGSKSP